MTMAANPKRSLFTSFLGGVLFMWSRSSVKIVKHLGRAGFSTTFFAEYGVTVAEQQSKQLCDQAPESRPAPTLSTRQAGRVIFV